MEKCGAPHSTAAGSSAAAAAPPGTACEQLCLLQNLKLSKSELLHGFQKVTRADEFPNFVSMSSLLEPKYYLSVKI